jgi:hypothetical protein
MIAAVLVPIPGFLARHQKINACKVTRFAEGGACDQKLAVWILFSACKRTLKMLRARLQERSGAASKVSSGKLGPSLRAPG